MWLSRFFGSSDSWRGRQIPRRARRRPAPVRLAVEPLEDRAVPAVYLVDTLADDGIGSLRQAVLDANDMPGADQVRFAAGLHGTFELENGEIAITDHLTIRGPGSNRLTISGENQSRIFRIDNGGDDVTDVSGIVPSAVAAGMAVPARSAARAAKRLPAPSTVSALP